MRTKGSRILQACPKNPMISIVGVVRSSEEKEAYKRLFKRNDV